MRPPPVGDNLASLPYITPDALREIKALPGYVRQRVKRAVGDLANDPYPAHSNELDFPDDLISEVDVKVRRICLDKWRILYAITETEAVIDVLAVRKRPPYDYGDLEALLSDL